jgi:tetratricopeptide (TPR) repeat protein
MVLDRFDKTILIFSALVVMGIGSFYIHTNTPSDQAKTTQKSVEKELAEQARDAFIDKIYAQVITLINAAKNQEALLKLEELNRRYPGEAHGLVLKGEILQKLNSPAEAAASFVAAIKINGDYIDRNHPRTRRPLIKSLVDANASSFSSQLKKSPENRSLKITVDNFNYLRSRLAGGCE